MSETSTRHLVDPDLLGVIDAAPGFELTLETLQEARRGFGARVTIEETSDVKTGIETTKVSIPGPANSPEVGIVIHQPRKPASSRGGILHVHGGGYVVGDPYVLAPAHRQLAFSLGCVVVSVDYRLAPETRFPGAVEDCYATLAWMNRNAGELALDADRLGVMGESAGGGLAAGLALLARDRGEFGVAFQHLIYPMLDDRTCTTDDPNVYAGEFIWQPHNNYFGWKCLLGVEPGSAEVSPYAAAARAEDLSRLPPTFILTGALDLFVDENMEYARRLMRAGVPTDLHVYAGAYHGFHFAPNARVTVAARRDSVDALARALDTPA